MRFGEILYFIPLFIGIHCSAAELLRNGDFEIGVEPLPAGATHRAYGVKYENLRKTGWYSTIPSTPDLWSLKNGYVPTNFFGMKKDLRENGKVNETHLGMDVSPFWNEVIFQKLDHPLSAGIEYFAGFWVARSSEDQSGWWEIFGNPGRPVWQTWHIPDPAKSLFIALLPEDFHPPFAHEGDLYESSYGPYIRVSTDPKQASYPVDPKDRDWHSINGSFIANGSERILALSSIPNTKAYKGYYFYDDVSLSCFPRAGFDMDSAKILNRNGIAWRVMMGSASVVHPETFWNSIRSRWVVQETDAMGAAVSGGFRRQSDSMDRPQLRGAEKRDLTSQLSRAPGLHYYQVTHQNTCVRDDESWESTAHQWIMVPTIHLSLEKIHSNCTEDEITVPYQLSAGAIQILHSTLTLKKGPADLQTIPIPTNTSSGVVRFKNPNAPGLYQIELHLVIDLGSGVTVPLSQVYPIEIEAPKISLKGPSTVPIGVSAEFQATSSLPRLPTSVQWSRKNDDLQWVTETGDSLKKSFAWAYPAKHDVIARAQWSPGCFADAKTSIQVLEVEPEILLSMESDLSCSDSAPLQARFSLKNPNLRVYSIEGAIVQSGSRGSSFSLDPNLREGSFTFERPSRPGHYLLELQISYEILPGKLNSLITRIPFQITLPQVFLNGPTLIPAGSVAHYRASHKARSEPLYAWTFSDDSGKTTSGAPGGSELSLIWNHRGNRELVVDLIWSEGCRATARLEPRVIGEETAYFPDAFTPDSNGLNDRYHPKGQDLWMSRFEIYDRWGARIYAALPGEVDQLMGWDGSIEGKPAPGGVYVCVAEYQSLITQKKMTYRGTFTLLK